MLTNSGCKVWSDTEAWEKFYGHRFQYKEYEYLHGAQKIDISCKAANCTVDIKMELWCTDDNELKVTRPKQGEKFRVSQNIVPPL